MDNQMDDIISQLSHIEDTAVHIMESADEQKKQIAAEMEQKTKEFDDTLNKNTDQKLTDIRKRLNQQKEAELKILKNDAEHSLKDLNEKFEKNHSVWAKEVLDSMIGA